MLVGYFDESGTSETQSKALTIAGYLGSPPSWLDFSRRWRAVLAKHSVPYFHASEVFAREGDFAVLRERRAMAVFMSDLIDVVEETELCSVAAGLVWSDYHAFLKAYPTFGGEHPYHLCFRLVLVRVAHVVAHFDPSERVAFEFEQSQQFQKGATRIFTEMRDGTLWINRHRLGSLRFGEKDDPRLQLADLFAWETRRYLESVILPGGVRPERQSFRRLRRQAVSSAYFEAGSLRALGEVDQQYRLTGKLPVESV